MTKILFKNGENVKKNGLLSAIHKTFNLDNSLQKTKVKRIFLFQLSTLDGLSNDRPLTTVYYHSAKVV